MGALGRLVVVWAAAVGVVFALTARDARAEGEPARITVHNDTAAGPAAAALVTFFTLGEPLAFVDWLCLEPERDVGPVLDVELARIGVLDDDGLPLGTFTSRSGKMHRFRAHPVPHGDAVQPRYCTLIRGREWRDDVVRFVVTRDASRASRLTFAFDGDARGCVGGACGELAPRFTGFAYGAAAARFTYGAVGFWKTSELGQGSLGEGPTRLRVAAFVPLLAITAGWPKSLRMSAQAGMLFPVTLASSTLAGDGGSAIGAGAGLYWAQCLDIRTPVVPRACIGVEIDGAVEGALRAGALDDVRPRLLFAWYVAVGAGAR